MTSGRVKGTFKGDDIRIFLRAPFQAAVKFPIMNAVYQLSEKVTASVRITLNFPDEKSILPL